VKLTDALPLAYDLMLQHVDLAAVTA